MSSVALCRGSDLAASGAGNGSVHLWAVGSETKDIQSLYDLPLVREKEMSSKLPFTSCDNTEDKFVS